jgi:hypothetical protein
MDSSAADSLLALSNNAAALVADQQPPAADDSLSADEPLSGDDALSDDDDLSPLSEVDEELYAGYEEILDQKSKQPEDPVHPADADSEAETERLQVTPENLAKKKPFEISPSKLSQRQDVDMRPEIESLTESPVSSPISSNPDSDNDEPLSDGPDVEEDNAEEIVVQPLISPTKRKREEASDTEDGPQPQRRRTVSPDSDDEKSDPESEMDDVADQHSPEVSPEPEPKAAVQDEDGAAILEEEQKEVEKHDTSEDSKGQGRNRPRRKLKDPVVQETQADEDEDAEAAEESDAADENDADAILKNEEEQAKRMQAMESLVSLERHFAALRDRLYDERIAAINHELQLLQEPKPAHPELIRQVEVVQKYRDDKFEIEQKLLVYKVGALKNKAVAERSQLHSQYFQTVRDIRDKHLERISEHFYRIQRDRFKADSSIPNFIIPFPEKRSQQILHQTAYNKEVSILSGVHKYVGFPAAPELAPSAPKDVEDDIQKMGVSFRQFLNVHGRD